MTVARLALAAALLAACGGGAPGGPSNGNQATPKATPAQGGGGGGSVDCAAITAAAGQLIGIQLLAQLTTPESVESIKSVGNLDVDEMLAALDILHALDGHSSALGDPKAAIDAYEEAAAAAKVLFAMDPVTQAALDAYNREHVGTIGEFLGQQIAVSGAIDEAGC